MPVQSSGLSPRGQDIVAAAAALFRAKGYAAVTIDDIATAAGVSRGTIYRYFDSKDAIRQSVAATTDVPAPQLEAPDVRARILDAAMTIIGRDGVDGATLEAIADAAGLTRTGVYWHFANRNELFRAIIATYTPLPLVPELIAARHDRPLDELFAQLLQAYTAFFSTRTEFFRAVLLAILTKPDFRDIFVENVFAPLSQTLLPELRRRMDMGELPRVPPVLIMQALLGPLLIHVLTRDVFAALLPSNQNIDETVALFLQIFTHGFNSLVAVPAPETGSEENRVGRDPGEKGAPR